MSGPLPAPCASCGSAAEVVDDLSPYGPGGFLCLCPSCEDYSWEGEETGWVGGGYQAHGMSPGRAIADWNAWQHDESLETEHDWYRDAAGAA